MDDYGASTTLGQAIQQPNVTGALQQMLLSRIHTPNQMQQLDQRRASTLQGYQQSLQQPASGNFSPSEQMLYSWINSLPSPYAVYKGIAAGGQQIANNEAARVQGNLAANKVEYEDAKDLNKLGVSELLAMRSLAGSKATGKFIQFHDDKGNLYIMNNATGEKQVIPASGAPLWQKVQTTAYEKAVSEGMANPEDYAVEVANRMVESSPAGFTSVDTQKPPVVGMGNNLTPTPVPKDESPIPQAQESTPATPTAPSTIKYRDQAEAARAKASAVGEEEAAIKDYNDNILPASKAAENTLNNVSMLRQIPRTQGAFLPYKAQVGSILEALGISDNKLVREANSVQEMRPILSKIANDRLLLAKGVQTEGDAQRAFNEFVKITDTEKATEYMYTWASELARRAQMRDQVSQQSYKDTGSRRSQNEYWGMTDYAKTAPVAILNGRPWGFSEWRDKFLKSNPTATLRNAIDEWNKLVRR